MRHAWIRAVESRAGTKYSMNQFQISRLFSVRLAIKSTNFNVEWCALLVLASTSRRDFDGIRGYCLLFSVRFQCLLSDANCQHIHFRIQMRCANVKSNFQIIWSARQPHLLHSPQHIVCHICSKLFPIEMRAHTIILAATWNALGIIRARVHVYKQSSVASQSQIESVNWCRRMKCTPKGAHRVFQPRTQNARPSTAVCPTIWWAAIWWWWCLIDRLILIQIVWMHLMQLSQPSTTAGNFNWNNMCFGCGNQCQSLLSLFQALLCSFPIECILLRNSVVCTWRIPFSIKFNIHSSSLFSLEWKWFHKWSAAGTLLWLPTHNKQ